jgi:integrase
MKSNKGEFGTVTAENGGAKFYFRCRSFVDIQTGNVLAERKQQKALLATRDSSIYKNLKSSALHIKAHEIRSKIIAWETAATTGQPVAGDGTCAATPPPAPPSSDITISKFFTEIFLPAKTKRAAITVTIYKRYWNQFLAKHFNSYLTFKNYQAWMGQQFLDNLKKEDGTCYGENTVNKIHSIASTIFRLAIERGYLNDTVPPRHNPWVDIKKADLPSVPKEQGVAYTESEVATVIRNLNLELGVNESKDALIRTAQVALALGFWAGLRPSEIIALQWQNVDVNAGTLKVCESVVNHIHAKRTKTSENRVVTYLEPLVPVLREWHKRNGSPKTGLVLQRENGKHVSPSYLGERVIAPNCKKHGLRWDGFYGCRRGCGTHLVQIGASLEQGAKFLGNTVAVFEENYWIDKGEGSAQAARIDRQHRLAKAKAADVEQAQSEQMPLHGELAALGIGVGGEQ